jgi:hypothetical protein
MKTREYEFEGQTYRWSADHLGVIDHRIEYIAGEWKLSSVPPTPAAASALAALIEDMQVQVIAEWESGRYPWRAIESENGPVVQFCSEGTWYQSTGDNAVFAAGYKAGEAAR